jgi:ribulose-5-phosphate 4-epimerase/fuculose-1-phosphate aldolase
MAVVSTLARSRPSLHNRVSPGEWQTRVDLAAAYRFADLKGWQEDYRIFNHFTARVPGEPDQFLIKPHDLLFSEVRASDLIKIDARGPKVGFEKNVNSAGFAIHSAVLNARPDVNAVLHLHSNEGMAVAALEGGLKFFTQEGMRFYNRVSYHAFEGIAEVDEGPRLVRDLGPTNNTLILRNHGLLTCGASVESAALNLACLIRICDVQLRMMASGEKFVQPSPETCEQTAQMYLRSTQGRTEWEAVLRYIDKHDSSYRE